MSTDATQQAPAAGFDEDNLADLIKPVPGRIDEQAARRPDFKAGIIVRLDDGQAWSLRKPRFRFRLAPGESGLKGTLDAQGEYQAALEAVQQIDTTSDDPDVGQKFIMGQLRLAHAVIRLNYDLSDDQVNSLVSWVSDEEDGPLDKVLEVAYGRAPKATTDGGPAA